jgi:hypothetical protein
MMHDISMFEHVRKIDPIRVMLGDNSSAMCSKVGTFVLKLHGGRRLRLSEELFVARLAIHLLSVAQLASKGIMSSFKASGCSFLDSEDGNSILATTSRMSDGLYVLRAEVCPSNNSRALAAMQVSSKKEKDETSSTSKEDLWHTRFGHVEWKPFVAPQGLVQLQELTSQATRRPIIAIPAYYRKRPGARLRDP